MNLCCKYLQRITGELMMQNRHSVSAIVCLLLCSRATLAQDNVVSPQEAAHKSFNISLGTQTVFVKELPIVAKLTFTGPAITAEDWKDGVRKPGFRPAISAASTSIYSSNANLRLVLTDKNGKQYVVHSSKGQNMTLLSPGGSTMSGEIMFYRWVFEGEERMSLLDLSSLRPELGGLGKTLADAPAGEYSLFLEINNKGYRSNTLEIILKSATPDELQLVSRLAKAIDPQASLKLFAWSEVLKKSSLVADEILPSQMVQKVSDEGAKQLSFYAFMAALLASKNYVQDRAQLERFEVPEYLAVEKESLLLEMDIMNGKESDEHKAKVERFLKLHPGLQWRIERAQKGSAEFSSYLPKPVPAANEVK